jgi:hypothetical protein
MQLPVAIEVVVHDGVECDNCEMCPILGVRYHCQECYQARNGSTFGLNGHRTLSLLPYTVLSIFRFAHLLHDVIIVSSSLPCAQYDLCEACEALGVHDPNHTLVKLRKPQHQTGASVGAVFGSGGSGKRGARAFVSESMSALAAAEGRSGSSGDDDDDEDEDDDGSNTQHKHQFGAVRREFSAALVTHATLDEGSVVAPSESLVKTWVIFNDGEKQWPVGTRVVMIGGDHLTNSRDVFPVAATVPGEHVEVSVIVDTPKKPGHYSATYSLIANGRHFGDRLKVEIVVIDETATTAAGSPGAAPAASAAGGDAEIGDASTSAGAAAAGSAME